MALKKGINVRHGRQYGEPGATSASELAYDANTTTKQKIDALATEVAGKADTDIVASDFDATASYTAGDYCIYEGKFYRFKNNHSGAWAAADVDEIKIAGELSSIKSGLNELIANNVSGYDDITATTIETAYVCPSDGYLFASSESDVTGVIRAAIADSAGNSVGYIYMNVTNEYQIQTLYLRKGFKVYVSNRTANAMVRFNKLV